ncbi:VirD4-like conjugal transfer protein, CD1115 family [Marasmitruncus massiliensis]|uniref:VirD4-like conjugal transfer protein, CD1115 family n=1 Tax=Marasmitruncus massiliensis TaxID=1944642 RepID=UPI000C7B2424|nr:type IV secretory system conjugative DNA transfer family protein [Marasmitruncus massiliensis]
MHEPVFILIAAGVIMFAVIGGLSLLAHYYTLNGIKSRTVGDGQHGTARFATKQEIKNTYQHITFTPKLWRQGLALPPTDRQGLILGSTGKKGEVTALVDTDDVHCLMIGASGVGKTAFFLYPNLEYACASGMSFLTTDTKGDLYRNYGAIAHDHYGYHVAVIDLRNPTRSDGNNMLHLVNKYMDVYRADENNLVAKSKAEKYAKIIAKTIINAGDENFGQNQFFYDAAEGLLTSVILLIAEYLPPTEVDGKKVDCRHIVSVFKLVQDLIGPSNVKGKSQFQLLMDKLPSDHKTRWFAGAALNSAEQAMMSVLSTILSRLNSFLDSEMEQILCFDTAIDAEKFCKEKSALFIVLPEEDLTKYFMVSLMIQQLYREILAVADENGGKLQKRVVFYCDELGTLPAIQSLELIFSASRSRRLTMVPIIQSFGQLEKNYGKEGSEIIVDNCQDTIFGGFAPNSQTAEILSKAMGSRTVMSGSISRGKNDPSQSLQMMERPLMTADELKSIPKGNFVVMKTGTHPMKTKLRLFLDWGIIFDGTYTVSERAHRKVSYADKQVLEENIARKHAACVVVDEDTGELLELPTGTGILHTPVAEQTQEPLKRKSHVRTQ